MRRTDAPRTINRQHIRVECAVAHQVLPGGHLAAEGWTEFDAYVDDIPRIQELVETEPELIEQAAKQLQRKKDAFVESKTVSNLAPGAPKLSWEDVQSQYEGPRTWQAVFRELNFRSCKPLRTVEVTEGVLPPPETGEETRMKVMMGEMLKAVASASDHRKGNPGRR